MVRGHYTACDVVMFGQPVMAKLFCIYKLACGLITDCIGHQDKEFSKLVKYIGGLNSIHMHCYILF